jgi:hypothetical protein
MDGDPHLFLTFIPAALSCIAFTAYRIYKYIRPDPVEEPPEHIEQPRPSFYENLMSRVNSIYKMEHEHEHEHEQHSRDENRRRFRGRRDTIATTD